MNKKKLFIIVSAIIILFIIIRLFTLLFDVFGIGGGKNPVDMNIREGASFTQITEDLKGSGVIKNKGLFKFYAKLSGTGIYQMGLHRFTPSMSYSEILDELERMPETEAYTVTIPEGYEIRQTADKLEEAGLINREIFMREIESGSFDYDFVRNIPNRENRLEGYLFPDTYTFSETQSEHDIINTMLKNFADKVLPVYEQSDKSKTLDEIINLASVVERESAGEAEHGKIASVFVNRINKGMKLESCATVQYILHERKPVLTNADTMIDSPYNTYMYNGLPIGPIASPGIKAIEAAIYPESSDYLYFLANSDGSESLFSVTFEEHLQKQQEIQR